jgi:glutamate 5-kinase
MELEISAATKRMRSAQRLVIKLGTSLVTTADGVACTDRLQVIVRSIVTAKRAGRQIVLVSSGAIGLGRARLGLSMMRLGDLVLKQACAAVGRVC